MSGQPTRINAATTARNHSERITALEQPRDPPWFYFTPVAPAAIPDDYVSGYAAYISFAGPWLNIGTDINGEPVAATAYRIFEGKLQLRLGCTGGEASPPSLIGTSPVGFRPDRVYPVDVVMGDDKLSRGTVEWRTNGEIWYLGAVV